MQHQSLGAVEHVGRAITARFCHDVGEVVAGLPLGVSEGEQQVAGGNLRDQLGPQRLAAAKPKQTAAEHDGREVGFERQRASDLLHHDHGLDRPAGRTAVLLIERESKEAKLGVPLPQRAAPAVRFLHVPLARIERIMVGEQALDAVLQYLLLFGQREIHL